MKSGTGSLKGLRVSIVGAGKVGRALGRLLRRRGASIDAVRCRSLAHAREAVRFIGAGRPQGEVGGGWVFVTVPDDALRDVVPALPGIRIHCAGALDAAEVGADGSFHPLRSFADPSKAAREFAGTPVAVEGKAAARLERIARAIGGVPFRIRAGRKGAYHAGAVFASNYVVAVVEAAVRLLGDAGVDRARALRILMPLVRSTVSNLESVGLPRALTGPVERGDDAVLRRHLERTGPLSRLYRELGRLAVGIARAKGSVDARAERRLVLALRER